MSAGCYYKQVAAVVHNCTEDEGEVMELHQMPVAQQLEPVDRQRSLLPVGTVERSTVEAKAKLRSLQQRYNYVPAMFIKLLFFLYTPHPL